LAYLAAAGSFVKPSPHREGKKGASSDDDICLSVCLSVADNHSATQPSIARALIVTVYRADTFVLFRESVHVIEQLGCSLLIGKNCEEQAYDSLEKCSN